MDAFLGLDISLTSTGYSIVSGGKPVLEGSIKTSKDEEWKTRVDTIMSTITDLIDTYQPRLVGIENYSYSSGFGREVLGELHGIIMYDLYKRNIPFFKVSPLQVKLFATGTGKVPMPPPGRAVSTWKKVWVIDAVNKNYDREFRYVDNDICDAFVIALLSEKLFNVKENALGFQALPKHHAEVIKKLLNPTTKKKKSRRKKNK